jgi:hypothetical protein
MTLQTFTRRIVKILMPAAADNYTNGSYLSINLNFHQISNLSIFKAFN